MCLRFHVLSYSHILLIEFKAYTMLFSLHTFLVTLMWFGMCLAVDYATTHPSHPRGRKEHARGFFVF